MAINDPLHIWYIIAAFFIIIESFAATIALLFIGLGALTTAISIHYTIVDSTQYILQVSLALIATGLWTLVLWKPLKNLKNKKNTKYKNILGSYATIVDSDLSENKPGRAKWSGTIMNTRIYSPTKNQTIRKGEEVEIVEVKGNTLFVKTK